jgi:hypothetical protein
LEIGKIVKLIDISLWTFKAEFLRFEICHFRIQLHLKQALFKNTKHLNKIKNDPHVCILEPYQHMMCATNEKQKKKCWGGDARVKAG